MSETTAVAVTKPAAVLPPDAQARIAENRERNAIVQAIRGTIWAKDLSDVQMRAVAQYCHKNNLDPVRHVEVLGGRIYLTSTLYEERAAPLIRRGDLVPHEPDHINADARLEALADAGDEWAKAEHMRRLRERIIHNVPEAAAGAVVYRITVAATGQTVVGVNWCGKGLRMKKRKDGSTYDDDPVGGNEPAKTAITRAGRRAWKQVADAVPAYGAEFRVLEQDGAEVSDVIVQDAIATDSDRPRLHGGATIGASVTSDAYGHGDDMPAADVAAARARDLAPDNDPYTSEVAA